MAWKSTVILVLTVPCFSRQPPSYEDIYPADITGKLKNGLHKNWRPFLDLKINNLIWKIVRPFSNSITKSSYMDLNFLRPFLGELATAFFGVKLKFKLNGHFRIYFTVIFISEIAAILIWV